MKSATTASLDKPSSGWLLPAMLLEDWIPTDLPPCGVRAMVDAALPWM
jgi:hypothetical protein